MVHLGRHCLTSEQAVTDCQQCKSSWHDAITQLEQYDCVLDRVGNMKTSPLKEASKTVLTTKPDYRARQIHADERTGRNKYVETGHKRGNVIVTTGITQRERLMSEHNSTSPETLVYEIRVRGHLSEQWQDWFDGMTIERAADGTSRIYGSVTDQAALHGLLRKVRDLGLTLISVTAVP